MCQTQNLSVLLVQWFGISMEDYQHGNRCCSLAAIVPEGIGLKPVAIKEPL